MSKLKSRGMGNSEQGASKAQGHLGRGESQFIIHYTLKKSVFYYRMTHFSIYHFHYTVNI